MNTQANACAEAFAVTVRESHGWSEESITVAECCDVEEQAWRTWQRAWQAGHKAAAKAQQPTEESAYLVGTTGAPHSEVERTLFLEYLRGHCWKDGLWSEEKQEYVDHQTCVQYAVWRARGALGQAASQIDEAAKDLVIEQHAAQIERLKSRIRDLEAAPSMDDVDFDQLEKALLWKGIAAPTGRELFMVFAPQCVNQLAEAVLKEKEMHTASFSSASTLTTKSS